MTGTGATGPGAGAADVRVRQAGWWIAAAIAGLAAAAVPVADEDVSARVIAAVLLAVSIPFGLLRPRLPVLWAVAIGWPTVVARLSQDAGAGSLLLLAYPLVGVYGGDWIAAWWQERYGRAPVRERPAGAPAPDPGRDADGLPHAVPGRWDAARRRADEEGASARAEERGRRDGGRHDGVRKRT